MSNTQEIGENLLKSVICFLAGPERWKISEEFLAKSLKIMHSPTTTLVERDLEKSAHAIFTDTIEVFKTHHLTILNEDFKTLAKKNIGEKNPHLIFDTFFNRKCL